MVFKVGLITLCVFLVGAAALPHKQFAPEKSTVEGQAPDPDLMFCVKVAVKISVCISENDFPFCNGTESKLQKCVNDLKPELAKCKYPLLTAALREKIRILDVSDGILCQSGLYKVFPNESVCWALAKSELIGISAFGIGLLTIDGCSVTKINRDAIIGYGYDIPKCSDYLKTYLLSLYKDSVCGYIDDEIFNNYV